MEIVSRFKDALDELERERMKIRRDRRGFLFVCYLLIVLGLACLASGFIAESTGLMNFAAVLFVLSLVPKFFGRAGEERFQDSFREKVTRPWFRERFLGVYLGPPQKEPTAEFVFMHKEAWKFLADWSLTPFKVVDRVFFDREEETSFIGTFATFRREYLVFMRKREGEWGIPESFVATLSKYGKVKTRSNAEGLWVALRLERRLFPVSTERETIDPTNYLAWDEDAKILLDPDVRLGWISAR